MENKNQSIILNQKNHSLFYFAIFVLIYVLAVILWGAVVRATGSGAGCGEHWPMCNGTVMPINPRLETLIELSHRVTSGLSLVLVLAMFIWIRRSYKSHATLRYFAKLSLIFILGEALVGALLVLQGLVAKDQSIYRALVIALHLVNTYFLIGALFAVVWITAQWSAFAQLKLIPLRIQTAPMAKFRIYFTVMFGLFLVLGATGAVVALGDTLFPATSLAHGFAQDMDSTAHFLIRLRVVHPILAVSASIFWVGVCTWMGNVLNESPCIEKLIKLNSTIVLLQVGLGVANLAFLAPIWIQLMHLLLAHTMWIAYLWLSFEMQRKSPINT